MEIKQVVIIGAGPAGIATAIQLKRYNIEPVILEQNEVGGLLRNANLVENYPGFPEGITGLALVELFRKQLDNAGIRVDFERVLELEYNGKIFSTRTDRRVIASDVIVIAAGTKPKEILHPPISDDIIDRIFYEIYPIIDVKNRKIGIIGAGDAAFDYALNLSQKNDVVILNRTNRVSCIPLLWEGCMKSDNISYSPDITVKDIVKADNGLLLNCVKNHSGEKVNVCVDFLVAAIGRESCLDFIGEELRKNSADLIKSNRLYMVGDVNNGIYRQTAICVGDGVKAAMEINRIIRKGAV